MFRSDKKNYIQWDTCKSNLSVHINYFFNASTVGYNTLQQQAKTVPLFSRPNFHQLSKQYNYRFAFLEEMTFSTIHSWNNLLCKTAHFFGCFKNASTCRSSIGCICKYLEQFDVSLHTCNFYACKNPFQIVECLDDWGLDNQDSTAYEYRATHMHWEQAIHKIFILKLLFLEKLRTFGICTESRLHTKFLS